MIILKDLVMEVSFKDVAYVLRREYPDDWYNENNPEGFEKVFKELEEKEPVPNQNGMKIVIKHVIEKWNDPEIPDAEYEDVYGKIEGDETNWGLDFTSWAEWLGMEVHPETLNKYSPAEIVAHCLWEMTFYGYTEEEIKEEKAKLEEVMEDVKPRLDKQKEELDPEMKANLEEFFDQYDETLKNLKDK